jgi:hypothetical protein
LSEDSFEKALDALLDDPEFLETVSDEVGMANITSSLVGLTPSVVHQVVI